MTDLIEILLLQFFEVEQLILRVANRSDVFIEFHLDGFVSRFCVPLDEHHEKGHDRGAGIDHELPGIAKRKIGPVTHTKMMDAATTRVTDRPVMCAVPFVNRVNQLRDFVGRMVPPALK